MHEPVKLALTITNYGAALLIAGQDPKIINSDCKRSLELFRWKYNSFSYKVISAFYPEVYLVDKLLFLFGARKAKDNILFSTRLIPNSEFYSVMNWVCLICNLLNSHALYPSFVWGFDHKPYFMVRK